ncbi:hypothetical protein SAMN06265365_11187 [Tistlia consotensis]|uniref:Lipoprotein n=1 Tax=Tistlia consotensis USBA 355 TaxID=560819 RepID=A0A1Y6BZ86_9PROT|nr:hypothetical protein [Tistlia consotensis]SMF33036.1 hypothetical protein SAMN05428998_11188 [Tistlia consotensis USBA 355]SNR69208.1 hypothetical protein SAMN06265365_11187 [Tistlia consotensis]
MTRQLALLLLAAVLLAGCSTLDLERAVAEWGRSLCQSHGDCRPGCSDGRSGSTYCR